MLQTLFQFVQRWCAGTEVPHFNDQGGRVNTDETARAIRTALERDPEINQERYPITVWVDDVVHLEGDVEDIITKRKALRLARHVAGLPSVIEDRLCVVTHEQVTSDALQEAVLNALRGEGAFRDMVIGGHQEEPENGDQDWIKVEVQNCRIHLTGEVNSLSHRRLAEVIAWWVPGCCDVNNRLHVRPPEADNDEEISDAVRLVFDKEPALDSTQISITTCDRKITLRGAVFNEEQKRIAAQDCWYIPGVHAVHNELQVVTPNQ